MPIGPEEHAKLSVMRVPGLRESQDSCRSSGIENKGEVNGSVQRYDDANHVFAPKCCIVPRMQTTLIAEVMGTFLLHLKYPSSI